VGGSVGAGGSVADGSGVTSVGGTGVGGTGVGGSGWVGTAVGSVVAVSNGVTVGGSGVCVGANVEVGRTDVSCFLRVAVGEGENLVGVGVFTTMDTDLSVTIADGVGVTVSLPVTCKKMGPAGLGTIFASICCARATAVLFILANERSCVLRACKSVTVGGVGLILAKTKIIHAIPEQSRRAARA
jgi:hypothetical protein